jgi:predicted MFS family arabinose efflux permease
MLLPIIITSNLFITMASDIALPSYVFDNLKGSALNYSLFTFSFALGLALGTMILTNRILKTLKEFRKIILFIILSDFLFMWISVFSNYFVSLCFIFLSGFFLGPVVPVYMTKMQEKINANHLGQSMAMVTLASKLSEPTGIALGGVFLSILGPKELIFYSCIASVILGIIIFLNAKRISIIEVNVKG